MSDLENTPVDSNTDGTYTGEAYTDGASPPEFGDLPEGAPSMDPAALSTVFDLSVPVAIELGRTRMSVQEVLALGRGSVVELDRLVGEPIDVFVADRRFAEGEVVVVGEQFGVRITRIIDRTGPASGAAS